MSENQLIDALLTGKPYFGPVMQAMQGPPVRHRYLAALVQALSRSKSQRDLYILEIGSWAGASAVTWATTIKELGMRGRIICVDLWQPYFDLTIEQESHYKEMTEAAKENKIFNLFLHNIRGANVSDMIEYIVGSAREVLPRFPSKKFDLVYIDGSHDYENVQSDIRQAKRLVRDGGIVCGDDLELQQSGLDEREHQAAVRLNKDYVHSNSGGMSYHPGVTEAVAREFGNVSTWEGVWATRKVGNTWTTIDLDLSQADMPAHIANACALNEMVEAGQTKDFWLGKSDTNFVAVAKSLGPTKLFAERLGERELPPVLFIGKSLEEIRAKATEVERETRVIENKLIGETETFNLVKSEGRFLAVAKRLGPLELFSERLGERELPPVLFTGKSLEEIRAKAFEVKQKNRAETELIDETEGFNLVKSGDRFLAVAKRLGPAELFSEQLGERELAPLLLTGETLNEIREKAQASERYMVEPEVELVDEVGEYNIIKSGARFVAVSKALGPLHLFRERVGERDLPPLVLVATDRAALRQRILAIQQKDSKNQDSA